MKKQEEPSQWRATPWSGQFRDFSGVILRLGLAYSRGYSTTRTKEIDPASVHERPLLPGSAPMIGAVRVLLSRSLCPGTGWHLSYCSAAVKKHCNYGNSSLKKK